MVTSPNEWKIPELDEKPQAKKIAVYSAQKRYRNKCIILILPNIEYWVFNLRYFLDMRHLIATSDQEILTFAV